MTWTRTRFWLSMVVAATVIGLFEGVQVYTGVAGFGTHVSWTRAFGSTMPSWYVLLALLPGIIWMSRRFPIEAGRIPSSIFVHLLAAALFTVVHISVASWLSDFVLYVGPERTWTFGQNLSRLLGTYFVVDLVTYFGIVGVLHAWFYARRSTEREREAAQLALKATRLEASLSRAHLDSLRMQLNPHFLFNTLNAVAVLAMKGERQGTVRMLTLLSDLLRITLETKQQVVSLRQELEFLDRYLEIEQVRFKDRLTVERDVEPDALTAEVPSLLLQPLVENALGHGIARQPGPGTIRIEARIVDGEVLELQVLDTGPGLQRSGATGRTGVGLANTRARLEELYGTRQQIILENRRTGGARVVVRLPLRLFENDDVGVEEVRGPVSA